MNCLRWTEADQASLTEHAIAAIVSNYKGSFIGETTAIKQLREKGLTEPEIWEKLYVR